MGNEHFDPTPREKPQRPLRPKDAATLILVRRDAAEPRILMGQRSRGHVFMPDKWVFPGGRVDVADVRAPAAAELRPEEERRLSDGHVRRRARAFALTAVRETFEETGLIVGKPDTIRGKVPSAWKEFASHGAAPDLSRF